MELSACIYINISQHNVQNIVTVASCSIYLKIMKMLETAYTTMRGEHNRRKNTTHYM